MIDQLRQQLDQLGENYVEKSAHFKIKVIPFFVLFKSRKIIRVKADYRFILINGLKLHSWYSFYCLA